MKDKERITLLQQFRDRHEHFDNLCFWLEDHWEDVVLYGLSTVIFVLVFLFVFIICRGLL